MSVAECSLDAVLLEIGDLGKYQKINFILVCLAVIYMPIHLSYIFTAKDLNYRCVIKDCDSNSSEFKPEWLPHAVPFYNDRPSKCEKYHFVTSNFTSTFNCSVDDFDRSKKEQCDGYVYETQEFTIVNDFNIHCNENLWKLTLVGTISNIGQFFCLPVSGFISDRYGRRTLLVTGLVLSSLVGLARSLAPTYIWFLLFEFLDTAVGSGTFSCAFILGLELVGPEKRVLSGTLISSAYVVGEITLGLIAWATQSWRVLLRIIYPPGLLILLYLWLTPESIRWLLAKGRHDDATAILKKVAKVNGKTISPDALEKLNGEQEDTSNTKETTQYRLFALLKSLPLMLRLINCSFCWITVNFLFYGLSLNSVALAGNSYLNFIMTACAEIPGYFATYVLVDRLGRRYSQFAAFVLTGFACFGFIFITEDKLVLKLIIYLIGKFGATLAFTVVYIFTSEFFPTPFRHSLLASCSMLGKLGTLIAIQAPLLAQVWPHLPILLFGLSSTLAGIVSLSFPETLNTKLPDTIEEAENIGKRRKSAKNSRA